MRRTSVAALLCVVAGFPVPAVAQHAAQPQDTLIVRIDGIGEPFTLRLEMRIEAGPPDVFVSGWSDDSNEHAIAGVDRFGGGDTLRLQLGGAVGSVQIETQPRPGAEVDVRFTVRGELDGSGSFLFATPERTIDLGSMTIADASASASLQTGAQIIRLDEAPDNYNPGAIAGPFGAGYGNMEREFNGPMMAVPVAGDCQAYCVYEASAPGESYAYTTVSHDIVGRGWSSITEGGGGFAHIGAAGAWGLRWTGTFQHEGTRNLDAMRLPLSEPIAFVLLPASGLVTGSRTW